MPDRKPEVYMTEDEIKEATRLRREREDQMAAARKPISGRKKKFDNYWYHYKWHTIAGIAALFLVCIFLKDTVFRIKPDATVVMISEQYFPSDELEELQEKLAQAAWDRGGDGKVYIQVDFIRMPVEGDINAASQEDYASQMKLMAVTAAGTDPLYLLDEAAYNLLVNMGRDDDEDEDQPATDNVFVPESAAADQFGLSGMKFYLRFDSGDDEYYQYCEELLQSLS